MSADGQGHCDHCDPGTCEGGNGLGSPPEYYDAPHIAVDSVAEWFDGHCPACAERMMTEPSGDDLTGEVIRLQAEARDAHDAIPDTVGDPASDSLEHRITLLIASAEERIAALAAGLNKPIGSEDAYQRGRRELAEELLTLVGEYQPGKGAWHYIMGALDIVAGKAEVLR